MTRFVDHLMEAGEEKMVVMAKADGKTDVCLKKIGRILKAAGWSELNGWALQGVRHLWWGKGKYNIEVSMTIDSPRMLLGAVLVRRHGGEKSIDEYTPKYPSGGHSVNSTYGEEPMKVPEKDYKYYTDKVLRDIEKAVKRFIKRAEKESKL